MDNWHENNDIVTYVKITKKHIALIGSSISLLLIGYLIGGLKTDTSPLIGDNSDDYPLLARRLFIENPNDTRVNFSELRTSLNTCLS